MERTQEYHKVLHEADKVTNVLCSISVNLSNQEFLQQLKSRQDNGITQMTIGLTILTNDNFPTTLESMNRYDAESSDPSDEEQALDSIYENTK